jgi:hypothetical protein
MTALRRALHDRLPDYMTPAVFVVLDALPLTPNGKVDRRALPAPTDARPDLDTAYVAPRNSTERELADIWSEVLGVEGIGIYDDFLDLGGHCWPLHELCQDLPLARSIAVGAVCQKLSHCGIAEIFKTPSRHRSSTTDLPSATRWTYADFIRTQRLWF